MAPKGPYIMECDNIYPCSYFTKGIKLSTKHKYFKKIRGWVDKKIYTSEYLQKIRGFFLKRLAFLASLWPYVKECDTIYPNSYFTSAIKLSYKNSYFKKIRGWIVRKKYASKYLQKISGIFESYPFFAPKGPFNTKLNIIYPCSYFTKGIKPSH